MRNFVEQSAISLMTDPGEYWYRALAKEAGKFIVVEPRQIVHGPTASNEYDRVGCMVARESRQTAAQGFNNLSRRTLALKAAVCVDKATDSKLCKSVGLF